MRTLRILGAPIILVLAALACNTSGSAAPTVVEATLAPTSITAATTAPIGQPSPTTGGALTAIPPTAVPPKSPQRISFTAGGTSASVQGSLNAEGIATYLINAGGGQTMTVTVTASSGTPLLSVSGPSGDVLKSSAVGGPSWSGVLPTTGDYTLAVIASGGPVAYTLQVTIPPLAQTGGSNAQCWVTTANAIKALRESSPTADVFGSAPAGEKTLALARATDGWLGFDPGVAQAGNQGRARLRWYQTAGASLSFDPAGCDQKLPVVLSMQSLQYGTYHVFELQDVKLTGGKYTDPNFDFAKTGDSVHDTFMGTAYAFGDLNGDGAEDAVIVLATNTGGTGTFVEIVPVINVNGTPQPGGSIQVGDRSPVNSMSIQAGVITAEVTVSGPNDAGCCPTLNETWTIKLASGKLVKQ